jgi:hypothetical protein
MSNPIKSDTEQDQMNLEEVNTVAGTAGVLITQEMRKHKGTVEDGLNIVACLVTNMLANFAMASERGKRSDRMSEPQAQVMMMLHMQLAEKLAETIVQVMGTAPATTINVETGEFETPKKER